MSLLDDDVDLESAGKSNFSKSPIMKLPKEGEVLVGKFLVLPDGSKRPYLPAPYYNFLVGDDPTKDSREHFSLKMIQDYCPKNDCFWENMKLRKKLKEEGKEGTPAYKKADATIAAMRPKTGGLLLFIEKGSKTIRPLFLKETMLEALFGCKDDAFRNKKARPGLVANMRSEGQSPYNLKNPTGWVKLYKVGSGRDTQFFAEVDEEIQESVINGKTRKVKVFTEMDVSQEVIDNILAGKIPDLLAIASNEMEMWTEAECLQYTKDFSVPERFKRKVKGSASSKSVSVAEEVDLLGGDFADEAEEVSSSVKNTAGKPVKAPEATDNFDDLF